MHQDETLHETFRVNFQGAVQIGFLQHMEALQDWFRGGNVDIERLGEGSLAAVTALASAFCWSSVASSRALTAASRAALARTVDSHAATKREARFSSMGGIFFCRSWTSVFS